jgi:membrane glycosyltransferase
VSEEIIEKTKILFGGSLALLMVMFCALVVLWILQAIMGFVSNFLEQRKKNNR